MLAATRYAYAHPCDTIFYPYDKGNITTVNTMVSGNDQGLATIDGVGTCMQQCISLLHYTVSRQKHSIEPDHCFTVYIHKEENKS